MNGRKFLPQFFNKVALKFEMGCRVNRNLLINFGNPTAVIHFPWNG